MPAVGKGTIDGTLNADGHPSAAFVGQKLALRLIVILDRPVIRCYSISHSKSGLKYSIS